MKILHIQWGVLGTADIEEAFQAEGHKVVRFPFSKNQDVVHNREVEEGLTAALHKETPDVVFSFDFFPVISSVCAKENIRYISWVFDDPCVFCIPIRRPMIVTRFMCLIKNCAGNSGAAAFLPCITCRWLLM